MIKILHVITSLDHAGAQILLMNLLVRMDRNKFIFHVAYLVGSDDLINEFQFDRNVVFHNLSIKGKFSVTSLYRLIQIIKRNKINAVHTHLVHAGLLGKIAGCYCKVKYQISTRHYLYNEKEKYVVYKLEELLSKHISAVIAVSGAIEKYLIQEKKYFPKVVHKIYNAVDTSVFHPHIFDKEITNKNVIGSIGRLHPIKNYELLLQVFNKLLDCYPIMHLEIIGEGCLLPKLQSMANNFKIDKNVHFLGKIPYYDINQYINRWQIFVSTSISEGFGIVIIESMSAGVPVIAPDIEPIREIIDDGKNGFLIDSQDCDSYFNKIKELISNQNLRRQFSINSREKVLDMFSYKTYVLKMSKFYDHILE